MASPLSELKITANFQKLAGFDFYKEDIARASHVDIKDIVLEDQVNMGKTGGGGNWFGLIYLVERLFSLELSVFAELSVCSGGLAGWGRLCSVPAFSMTELVLELI